MPRPSRERQNQAPGGTEAMKRRLWSVSSPIALTG